jgi:hypothetical protein
MTVVPAYGRDYSSKKEVLSDWENNKDFQICDIMSQHDGSYINKQDAENYGVKQISVRYNKLRKVMVIKT